MPDKTDDKDLQARLDEASMAKRPHATLDLKATEVKEDTSEGTASTASAPAQDEGEAQAAGAEAAQEEAEPTPEAAEPEEQPGAPVPPAGPSVPPARTTPGQLGWFMTHLAAGLIGGLIALVAAFYGVDRFRAHLPFVAKENAAELEAQITGLRQDIAKLAQPAGAQPTEASAARLEALERKIAEISPQTRANSAAIAAMAKAGAGKALGAPTSDKAGAAAISALDARIAKLEKAFARQIVAQSVAPANGQAAAPSGGETAPSAPGSTSEGLAATLAQVQSDIGSLDQKVAVLDQRLAGVDGKLGELGQKASGFDTQLGRFDQKFAGLSQEVAGLKKRLKTVESGQARRNAEARGVALAAALNTLRQALAHGEPYAQALATVGRLSDAKFAAPVLTAHRDQGVATLAALQADFAQTAEKALRAAAGGEGGSLLDKLASQARDIIRIRPTGMAKGNSPAAIIARAETRLKAGAPAAAIAELQALKGQPAVIFQPWIAKAQTRIDAEAEIDALERQVFSRLKAENQPAGARVPASTN